MKASISSIDAEIFHIKSELPDLISFGFNHWKNDKIRIAGILSNVIFHFPIFYRGQKLLWLWKTVFWHSMSPFVFLQRDRESLADMEIRQAAERRRLIKEMQKDDDDDEDAVSHR